jgi:hypothetical protein
MRFRREGVGEERAKSLRITVEELAELVAMAQPAGGTGKRAKMILLTEDGLSDREAAARLDASRLTVSV